MTASLPCRSSLQSSLVMLPASLYPQAYLNDPRPRLASTQPYRCGLWLAEHHADPAPQQVSHDTHCPLLDYLPSHLQMWFVAGLFTLLALPVSIYEVAMHLEYFTRPKLQIRVIRILWMVPIYAIDCFLSLTPQFHVSWHKTALNVQGVASLAG